MGVLNDPHSYMMMLDEDESYVPSTTSLMSSAAQALRTQYEAELVQVTAHALQERQHMLVQLEAARREA